MDKNKIKFWDSILLFISFLIMAISGFVLWLIYPAGKKSGQAGVIFLFDRFQWIKIHSWVAVIFIILIFIHLLLNWAWIKAMFKKAFSRTQNQEIQENQEKV
jgi:cytochrome b subunit of formate dehydrogenase